MLGLDSKALLCKTCEVALYKLPLWRVQILPVEHHSLTATPLSHSLKDPVQVHHSAIHLSMQPPMLTSFVSLSLELLFAGTAYTAPDILERSALPHHTPFSDTLQQPMSQSAQLNSKHCAIETLLDLLCD